MGGFSVAEFYMEVFAEKDIQLIEARCYKQIYYSQKNQLCFKSDNSALAKQDSTEQD